ncbi:LLM class F420-dependent oxidoreductase, partial [Streptomyces sp. SID10244]|nr:LLM class F420-dependent oxidoreductase [Streptomyces sp. SID10244]
AVREAEQLVAAGISLITVGSSGPDYDLSVLEAVCKWRDSQDN